MAKLTLVDAQETADQQLFATFLRSQTVRIATQYSPGPPNGTQLAELVKAWNRWAWRAHKRTPRKPKAWAEARLREEGFTLHRCFAPAEPDPITGVRPHRYAPGMWVHLRMIGSGCPPELLGTPWAT